MEFHHKWTHDDTTRQFTLTTTTKCGKGKAVSVISENSWFPRYEKEHERILQRLKEERDGND